MSFFPLRDWHLKHMENTVVKFVKGLSENSTNYERRMHRKYGTIYNIRRQINHDIVHGVTSHEVISFLQKIEGDPTFSDLLKNNGAVDRVYEIKKYFGLNNEI